MLSCKEIARILSSDEKLSIMRKSELRMHLLMCKHCSNYNRQLKFLQRGMKTLFRKKTAYPPEKLTQLENDILDKNLKKDER